MDAEQTQRYCMKIDHSERVSADTGQRLYVLAAGQAVDEEGKPDVTHVLSGLVGAFVVEGPDGKAEIVAGSARIDKGASGAAPNDWKFVKLGPSDYWGWQNRVSDCHQGYCGSRYSILAPYGRGIRELAGFVASYDEAGTCSEEPCAAKSTSLESQLDIDSTKIDQKVFPLLVTVTGENKGTKMRSKTWTLLFNPTKWSYPEPNQWPLKGRDF